MENIKREHIPQSERKNLLVLSDDIRSNSGIATMSKEFIVEMAHRFNIIQVGAAIKNPDQGKIIDVSDQINELAGINDAYVRIYPYSGYGDANLIRYLINVEKINVILHYTDPRFWEWLYNIAHELRQSIPIVYYNIWDCPPPPKWNFPYYRSSDLIMNISKQTHILVKEVLGEENYVDRAKNPKNVKDGVQDTQILDYVPHGINHNLYYPIKSTNKELIDFKNTLFAGDEFDFVVLFNNRNIHRKNPSDVINAFKTFNDLLSEEDRKKVALIMHTNIIDKNGTNLYAVRDTIAPDANIFFSDNKFSQSQLNQLYNSVDLTINIASNEGFGLTTAESLMTGTPMLANVTGGLQDQMGFRNELDELLTVNDYTKEFYTNSIKKYKTHGQWVYPVYPAVRTLNGSVKTPYIFDEKANTTDVAKQLYNAYLDNKEGHLKKNGALGRDYLIENGFTAEYMGSKFIENIEYLLENWKPISRFKTIKIS